MNKKIELWYLLHKTCWNQISNLFCWYAINDRDCYVDQPLGVFNRLSHAESYDSQISILYHFYCSNYMLIEGYYDEDGFITLSLYTLCKGRDRPKCDEHCNICNLPSPFWTLRVTRGIITRKVHLLIAWATLVSANQNSLYPVNRFMYLTTHNWQKMKIFIHYISSHKICIG